MAHSPCWEEVGYPPPEGCVKPERPGKLRGPAKATGRPIGSARRTEGARGRDIRFVLSGVLDDGCKFIAADCLKISGNQANKIEPQTLLSIPCSCIEGAL